MKCEQFEQMLEQQDEGALPKPALRPFLPADGPVLAQIFRESIAELTGEEYDEAQQAESSGREPVGSPIRFRGRVFRFPMHLTISVQKDHSTLAYPARRIMPGCTTELGPANSG